MVILHKYLIYYYYFCVSVAMLAFIGLLRRILMFLVNLISCFNQMYCKFELIKFLFKKKFKAFLALVLKNCY